MKSILILLAGFTIGLMSGQIPFGTQYEKGRQDAIAEGKKAFTEAHLSATSAF